MAKKITFTLSVLGAIVSAHAQSEFLGLPVSAYLDNISDSAAIQRKASYVPPAALGTRVDDDRFWAKKRFSLSYSYANTGFDGSNDDIGAHAVVPELFLESRAGQALNFGGAYSSASQDLGPIEADSDTYGFSVQPAQELWRFLCPDDLASQLWLGFGAGYRTMDSEFTLGPASADVETDTFFIGPNLVFARGITDRLSALIIPAYTMEWSNTDFGAVDEDSDGSLFTLTGRADYGVTDNVILTGFATYKRDIHMDIDGVPSSALDCHSWAEFGGSVRVGITEDIGLRAGYSYEAFHPDFDRHKFAARLELGF